MGASTQALGDDEIIEEVVVTAASSIHDRLGNMGSASVLSGEEIAAIGATHVNEILARVPGVWISRGSGQEHLAAIRSPVYTGAGACGEFSYLENGIPIRPAGFCNVNNLFEVNTEQAQAIEVWRGPASAVLGGNALHGAINVITPKPRGFAISVEGGPYDFARMQVSGGIEIANHQLGASLISVSSAGYRDDTGYDQQKFLLNHQTQWREWQISNTLSASLLNQETGGFVRGFEAYDDSTLRTSNPNPEAYRDAWSLRLSSEITKDEWTIKPYLRRSKMAFLQHFLPGQPLEKNEQSSGGVIVNYTFERGNAQVDLGAHLEYMQGELSEFQSGPTIGSAFLVATRPAGLHYDYDVDSLMAAVFYNLSIDLRDDVRLIHSLRIEHLAYDYVNNSLVGNTRDDGTPCGFGGCLYTRPASGDDEFTNVAVRVGVEKDFGDYLLYGTVSTGFRPPQATELYRLRGGQVLADLDSQELVSVEIGLKNSYGNVSLFSEKARNLILRDSEAFNVSDGKTVSVGVELEAHWSRGAHTLSLATTWARHEYDFNRMATGREIIEDGNQIDTAPRWLTNARWQMDISESLRHELELNIVGEHYVNAANTAKYDGHQVLNWRGDWQASRNLNVYARIINLLDERYADRADFAFGSYRYFPAMPRQLYVGVRYQLQ
ncbi:MAG: TonB-dependent receptor [Gammaproteobacteria bacterium]|nr:TonB-dependent receptor [Gammaproteobacteria bacterium]